MKIIPKMTLEEHYKYRSEVIKSMLQESLKQGVSLEEAKAQAERISQQSQSTEQKGASTNNFQFYSN